MEVTKQKKFFLAVGVQLLIIFAIIIFKLIIFATGTEVLLRIEPIDPRDPLRGDYATLQYSISNLGPYLFTGQLIKNGDTVYVSIRSVGEYWEAQSAKKSKPTNKDEIYLKGKVVSGAESVQSSNSNSNSWTPAGVSGRVHVVYGIEEYFISEGKGTGLNTQSSRGLVSAKVAIDENGNSVLKQVYIDGKKWP